MDDKRKLTGHPWHVEILTMAEGDTRRHKKRCVYYSQNNYCRKICGNCFGSSHCSYYKESGAKQLSRQQIDRQQIEEMLRKIFKER